MGKQFIIITLTLVLVLGFSKASMSWMNGRHGGGSGYNYVDEDGDGICDHYSNGRCPGYRDQDGDGICDNYNNGGCPGYRDQNGDGVCDNYSNGTCPGYRDEDGDGICDNRRGGRNFPGHDNRGARGGIPFINILDGEPFTYTGEVVSLGYFGKGTVISTNDGEITVYGLGPLWYWDCKEISRPVVGNVIEVSGYTVEYNSVQRNVVTSITIGGEILELRDPETGEPLWRGNNKWSCQ